MRNHMRNPVNSYLYTNYTNYQVHQHAMSSPIYRSPLPLFYNKFEETVIIEGTYNNYRTPRRRSVHSYNYQPTIYEETLIFEEALPSYNQPSSEVNLEPEERMGQVDSSSRLSEKTIMGHLKIRRYDATSTKRTDEEPDICVICQCEYEKKELIGGLECRHEYHVECVKKWLQQHNTCPICKAAAIPPNGNN